MKSSGATLVAINEVTRAMKRESTNSPARDLAMICLCFVTALLAQSGRPQLRQVQLSALVDSESHVPEANC
jgi:hypothetical protein